MVKVYRSAIAEGLGSTRAALASMRVTAMNRTHHRKTYTRQTPRIQGRTTGIQGRSRDRLHGEEHLARRRATGRCRCGGPAGSFHAVYRQRSLHAGLPSGLAPRPANRRRIRLERYSSMSNAIAIWLNPGRAAGATHRCQSASRTQRAIVPASSSSPMDHIFPWAPECA